MSGPRKISTPRGELVLQQAKNGSGRIVLTWNDGFGTRANTVISQGQAMMDGEVLRGSSPYVPKRTGMLMESGTLGTTIGSGEVRWVAPYAGAQYYRKSTGSNGEARRGGYWFERWKNASGKATIDKIKKKVGGSL